MTLNMNDSHITSIAQLRELLKVTTRVEFKSKNKKETYEWIGKTLGRFHYFGLKKKDKSIIKRYIMAMTGVSDAQLTRLIQRKKEKGVVTLSSTKRHRFPKK